VTRTIREFAAFFPFPAWQARQSYLSKVHAEHVERSGGVNAAVSGGGSLQGHLQGVVLWGFSLSHFWEQCSVREPEPKLFDEFFFPAIFGFSSLKAKSLLETSV